MLRRISIAGDVLVELFFEHADRGIACSEIEVFEGGRRVFRAELVTPSEYQIDPKEAGEDPRNREIIARAVTMASALDQQGASGFLAVAHDGRIVGMDDTALDAFFDAERRGWEGWAAHDPQPDAIAIVPMRHVRLRRDRDA